MILPSSRIQDVFKKTKSICFGRFVVDVPDATTVSWGIAHVPLGVTVYPDGLDQVRKLEGEFVKTLKETKAIYHEHAPLLLEEQITAQPVGKIVTGYENFDSLDELKIHGYFYLQSSAFIIDTRPFREYAENTIAEMKGMARRFRLRAEKEVPTEPGNCIDHAFMPDEIGQRKELVVEHVRVGFRLTEFPDTHVSIYVAPPNRYGSESDSLEWQIAKIEKWQRVVGIVNPFLRTRFFRSGARQIGNWLNGWETLSRSPDREDVYGFHDFAMDVKGVIADPLQPYFDIRMQTGVGGNSAGAVRPSLTDEEAVAVWDKITSSIRQRPTDPTPSAASMLTK